MTTTSKPAPSVIRPGKAPEGPPGWEERRIEKQMQAEQAQEKRNHRRENSTGIAGIKEKVHKIGEKMHLVEPKDPAQRSAAQLQVSSTETQENGIHVTHLTSSRHFALNRTLRLCLNKLQCSSRRDVDAKPGLTSFAHSTRRLLLILE